MRSLWKTHLQRRLSSISRPPVLPCGLCIDRERSLANTTPPYTKHVVISTGRDDWASRIENEESPNLARGLKEMLGRNGELHDPNNNVLVTNSSFSPTGPSRKEEEGDFTSAYLFPDFQYIPYITNTPDGHRAFARQYLLPTGNRALPSHDGPTLNPEQSSRPPTDTTRPSHASVGRPVLTPIVLICGHATRDQRCGIYGPLLRAEFNLHLHENKGHPLERSQTMPGAALISHMGGHAFAGNVIIYLPPNYTPSTTEEHISEERTTFPLANTGIWYGRVEPERVRDVVTETIEGGRIIEELFRGGIRAGGGPLTI